MRALITGATSGIGLALTHELAASGYTLTLVARDPAVLAELAQTLTGSAHDWIAADLQAPGGIDRVAQRLADDQEPIDVLVHSAGIGLPPGGYLGNGVAASDAVHRVTIDALTALAHAALPGMLARGRGGIITVGSIAGFLPGSAAITYSASKAWAHAFGEGLNELTRGTGVTSTVVAPGFVRSGFHTRAGLGASGIHRALWLTPEVVARAAVRGFARRRALVIPGGAWKCVYAATRVLPRNLSRRAFAAYMAWTARRAA